MFKKYFLALVLVICVISSFTVLATHGAYAEPFMDGFPDWAQDAMGGSD